MQQLWYGEKIDPKKDTCLKRTANEGNGKICENFKTNTDRLNMVVNVNEAN